MVTRVFPVDPVSPSPRVIEEVAAILKRGGLVAFPTETVYGLGADGLDGEAVRRIFVAKGRPQDNPLILHVSGRGQVGRLVDFIPDAAELLMDAFWPGPLTLVLKKSGVVPDVVSAGLDSVAVRMPANAVASALISAVGRPLAAPSANLSGRPSPTAAEHVVEDLDGRVDAVLDGGVVDIGIESTVVDLSGGVPRVLRPGKVTREQLEAVVGEVRQYEQAVGDKPRSPGMKYKHYSPDARIIVVKDRAAVERVLKDHPGEKVKVLDYEGEADMARNLFRDFRLADKEGYGLIVVREVSEDGFGYALMDKLRKASGG